MVRFFSFLYVSPNPAYDEVKPLVEGDEALNELDEEDFISSDLVDELLFDLFADEDELDAENIVFCVFCAGIFSSQ